MSITERLEYIRKRAKKTIPLSATAANVLEQLKESDPDIGGPATVGEVLPAESVRKRKPEPTQDEENNEAEFISPAMRAALD